MHWHNLKQGVPVKMAISTDTPCTIHSASCLHHIKQYSSCLAKLSAAVHVQVTVTPELNSTRVKPADSNTKNHLSLHTQRETHSTPIPITDTLTTTQTKLAWWERCDTCHCAAATRATPGRQGHRNTCMVCTPSPLWPSYMQWWQGARPKH